MQTLEDVLYKYMVEQGVDRATAAPAAKNCAASVIKFGAGGFAIGATVGYATANPSALLMGAVTGAAGGLGAMALAPSCSEVRQAAQNWANGVFQ